MLHWRALLTEPTDLRAFRWFCSSTLPERVLHAFAALCKFQSVCHKREASSASDLALLQVSQARSVDFILKSNLLSHEPRANSIFAVLKNSKHMNFVFCKLKTLKKHEFHFLQAKKPQKTWISFFASLKNLKKHEFHFLQLKKPHKT